MVKIYINYPMVLRMKANLKKINGKGIIFENIKGNMKVIGLIKNVGKWNIYVA